MAQQHRAIYLLVLLIAFGVGSSSASRDLTQTHQANQGVMGLGARPYIPQGAAIRGDRGGWPYVSGPPGVYGPYEPYVPYPGVYRGGWPVPYVPPQVYPQPGYGVEPGYRVDPGYGVEPGYRVDPGYGEPGYGVIPGYGSRAPCMYLPGSGACVPIGGGPGGIVYGQSADGHHQTTPRKPEPQPQVHA